MLDFYICTVIYLYSPVLLGNFDIISLITSRKNKLISDERILDISR